MTLLHELASRMRDKANPEKMELERRREAVRMTTQLIKDVMESPVAKARLGGLIEKR